MRDAYSESSGWKTTASSEGPFKYKNGRENFTLQTFKKVEKFPYPSNIL
jgi:hypothetical protein